MRCDLFQLEKSKHQTVMENMLIEEETVLSVKVCSKSQFYYISSISVCSGRSRKSSKKLAKVMCKSQSSCNLNRLNDAFVHSMILTFTNKNVNLGFKNVKP